MPLSTFRTLVSRPAAVLLVLLSAATAVRAQVTGPPDAVSGPAGLSIAMGPSRTGTLPASSPAPTPPATGAASPTPLIVIPEGMSAEITIRVVDNPATVSLFVGASKELRTEVFFLRDGEKPTPERQINRTDSQTGTFDLVSGEIGLGKDRTMTILIRISNTGGRTDRILSGASSGIVSSLWFNQPPVRGQETGPGPGGGSAP